MTETEIRDDGIEQLRAFVEYHDGKEDSSLLSVQIARREWAHLTLRGLRSLLALYDNARTRAAELLRTSNTYEAERDQLRRQLDAAEAQPCDHDSDAFGALERLHSRIHRDFNFDAGECAPPEGETALRMMDDLVAFADEVYLPLADATAKSAPSTTAPTPTTTWTAPDGTVYDLAHGWRDRTGNLAVCIGWIIPFDGQPVPLIERCNGDPLDAPDLMEMPELIERFGPLRQDAEPGPLESAVAEARADIATQDAAVVRHVQPGIKGDAPEHPGLFADCEHPVCAKSRRQHEAAADIQALTAELFAEPSPPAPWLLPEGDD